MTDTNLLNIEPQESLVDGQQEAFRVFKTEEEFQGFVDSAIGKRLYKLREQQDELEREKKALDDREKELNEKFENAQKIEDEASQQMLEQCQSELNALFEAEGELYKVQNVEELLKDNKFKALLKSGCSVKEAFDMTHIDKIIEKSVKEENEKLLRSIRTKAIRPEESALSGYGSFSSSVSVKNLSDRQRADIRERVRRGEKIVF
jgi:hypothetical protein